MRTLVVCSFALAVGAVSAGAIPVQVPAAYSGGPSVFTDDFQAVATARVIGHPQAQSCGARLRPSLWSRAPGAGGRLVRGSRFFRINACRSDLPGRYTGELQFGFDMWGLDGGRYVLCIRATQSLRTSKVSSHRTCTAFRY